MTNGSNPFLITPPLGLLLAQLHLIDPISDVGLGDYFEPQPDSW